MFISLTDEQGTTSHCAPVRQKAEVEVFSVKTIMEAITMDKNYKQNVRFSHGNQNEAIRNQLKKGKGSDERDQRTRDQGIKEQIRNQRERGKTVEATADVMAKITAEAKKAKLEKMMSNKSGQVVGTLSNMGKQPDIVNTQTQNPNVAGPLVGIAALALAAKGIKNKFDNNQQNNTAINKKALQANTEARKVETNNRELHAKENTQKVEANKKDLQSQANLKKAAAEKKNLQAQTAAAQRTANEGKVPRKPVSLIKKDDLAAKAIQNRQNYNIKSVDVRFGEQQAKMLQQQKTRNNVNSNIQKQQASSAVNSSNKVAERMGQQQNRNNQNNMNKGRSR